jgi:spore coat protein A, manganese oxidase
VCRRRPERVAESSLPRPFTVPFSVPPVATPVTSVGTTDYYWLTMRQKGITIIPGHVSNFWGYDGSYPGPTFEQQCRESVVRQANQLPSIHPTQRYTRSPQGTVT